MRVQVRDEKCQGHGMCAIVCANVFSVNEDTGRARVVLETVPAVLEDDVQAARDSCPEQAIEIY